MVPFGNRTRLRCKFGRKTRLFDLVTWVPMPPLFLLWPFREIDPPVTGRLPVIAQILDIARIEFRSKGEESRSERPNCKRYLDSIPLIFSRRSIEPFVLWVKGGNCKIHDLHFANGTVSTSWFNHDGAHWFHGKTLPIQFHICTFFGFQN